MNKFPDEKKKFDEAMNDFMNILNEKKKVVRLDDVIDNLLGSRVRPEKWEDKFLTFAVN